jgi:hypothetical protein
MPPAEQVASGAGIPNSDVCRAVWSFIISEICGLPGRTISPLFQFLKIGVYLCHFFFLISRQFFVLFDLDLLLEQLELSDRMSCLLLDSRNGDHWSPARIFCSGSLFPYVRKNDLIFAFRSAGRSLRHTMGSLGMSGDFQMTESAVCIGMGFFQAVHVFGVVRGEIDCRFATAAHSSHG